MVRAESIPHLLHLNYYTGVEFDLLNFDNLIDFHDVIDKLSDIMGSLKQVEFDKKSCLAQRHE